VSKVGRVWVTLVGAGLLACGRTSQHELALRGDEPAVSAGYAGMRSSSGAPSNAGGAPSGGNGAGGTALAGGESGGTEMSRAGVGGTSGHYPPLPLGKPGWRDSTVPLCEAVHGHTLAFDVWASDVGVYALFGTDCNALAEENCDGQEGLSLQLNDGKGWQAVYDSKPAELKLSGVPTDGPALLTGFIDGNYGIYAATQHEARPFVSLPFNPDANRAPPFMVTAGLGYFIDYPDLLELSDGKWGTVATLPDNTYALWADAQVVIVSGLEQTIAVRARGEADFNLLPDVPTGDYLSVWAFGADDIWAGNAQKQIVHFDGKSWQVFETGSKDETGSGIVRLWGAPGVVYFMTFTEVGRVTLEGGAELLLKRQGPPDRFVPTGLWGRSANEVFVSFSDADAKAQRCGSAVIAWFDGTEFHRF
jgi:hypothetical protein